MRGLKMARRSPLGKGAGTGGKMREKKMKGMWRLLLLDILLIATIPGRMIIYHRPWEDIKGSQTALNPHLIFATNKHSCFMF